MNESGFFAEMPPDGIFNKFPSREAIEGKPLEVCDTPLRNLLPRVPGAGMATQWKQRGTFGERFQTCGYKLLGAFGALRGFSIASGQTYKDLLGHEKQNTLLIVMQNEENALINADSTSSQAPWGDGTRCLSYNGLLNEITVENGVPAANICENVGELTTAHIDAQLDRCWQSGGRGLFILWGRQEQVSIREIVARDGSPRKYMLSGTVGDEIGVRVTGYGYKKSKETVPILCSRFVPAGTILFGALYGPEGKPAIDVEVAGDYDNGIQEYCCTELARSTNAPDVFPFLVSVYEVLKVRDLMCFAKSTGVLPVKSGPRESDVTTISVPWLSDGNDAAPEGWERTEIVPDITLTLPEDTQIMTVPSEAALVVLRFPNGITPERESALRDQLLNIGLDNMPPIIGICGDVKVETLDREHLAAARLVRSFGPSDIMRLSDLPPFNTAARVKRMRVSSFSMIDIRKRVQSCAVRCIDNHLPSDAVEVCMMIDNNWNGGGWVVFESYEWDELGSDDNIPIIENDPVFQSIPIVLSRSEYKDCPTFQFEDVPGGAGWEFSNPFKDGVVVDGVHYLRNDQGRYDEVNQLPEGMERTVLKSVLLPPSYVYAMTPMPNETGEEFTNRVIKADVDGRLKRLHEMGGKPCLITDRAGMELFQEEHGPHDFVRCEVPLTAPDTVSPTWQRVAQLNTPMNQMRACINHIEREIEFHQSFVELWSNLNAGGPVSHCRMFYKGECIRPWTMRVRADHTGFEQWVAGVKICDIDVEDVQLFRDFSSMVEPLDHITYMREMAKGFGTNPLPNFNAKINLLWFYDVLDQQWHRVTGETETTFTFDRNGQEKTIDKAADFVFERSEDRPVGGPK